MNSSTTKPETPFSTTSHKAETETVAGADTAAQTWFENTNTVLAGLLQTVLELHDRIKVLEAR